MKKYISPIITHVDIQTMSTLLSSGSFTFTIPGELVNYDTGGDLGDGV